MTTQTKEERKAELNAKTASLRARRMFLDRNTKAELAIFQAMQEVEQIGCSEGLTEAVTLLAKAKDLVGDFIDEQLKGETK